MEADDAPPEAALAALALAVPDLAAPALAVPDLAALAWVVPDLAALALAVLALPISGFKGFAFAAP